MPFLFSYLVSTVPKVDAINVPQLAFGTAQHGRVRASNALTIV